MLPKFDKDGLAIESGYTRVFYFSYDTKEYSGWSDEYINVGVSLPASSTQLDPGNGTGGEVAVFNRMSWERVEDHRGEIVFSTLNGNAITIFELGTYPENITPLEPSTPYDIWNGTGWVTDIVAQHAAEVVTGEAEKQARIGRANEYINSRQWPGKAAMGRLSDAERSQYNDWLDFLDLLEAVDISTAPNITWPEK
ncbi:tail fiber assembly protein [Citrobacter sp. S2-9]|uniref:Tail fiber assembly protein n=1 Tax=Citrobacter enshiensis TaxID=2971264 RepID=A0ABT8PWE9_9ENTR|nr:tail fiber assembly protein [Citrobacter enshiensis]MDN8600668.1 tail fiber assembly protein [Citrobacter enshiensis]